MRLAGRLFFGLPTGAGLRNRLVGTRFVLTPDLQPERLTQRVGLLNQFFFVSASGSTTVTTPSLRLRWAVPVGHQVRVR